MGAPLHFKAALLLCFSFLLVLLNLLYLFLHTNDLVVLRAALHPCTCNWPLSICKPACWVCNLGQKLHKTGFGDAKRHIFDDLKWLYFFAWPSVQNNNVTALLHQRQLCCLRCRLTCFGACRGPNLKLPDVPSRPFISIHSRLTSVWHGDVSNCDLHYVSVFFKT